ncbi:sugar kinase [Solirubrobacter sp. CPCC 204708]|uniref:Sugar kinase n=1 Tax=Solirubrobacter deserti TaxID=2282478 RepID=A0ABT4RDG3_9ACTN|nr:sugar kinase [Solirubrobacter deserti]MBE2314554.1 sugar kinase [Solirubrobacter deserti]MDA0136558.1 sugar kinase [Solirubrobacter deserti]
MLDAVTFGEALATFVALDEGDLASVSRYERILAGAEVNVAIGLARLGHTAGYVTRVGDDPFGRFVRAAIADAGVDASMIETDRDAPTAFQLKAHAGGGDPETHYFRRGSSGTRLAPSPATDAYVRAARHLHVTGIPLALSDTARAFAARAVEVATGTISFDPNLRPVLWGSEAEMVREINGLATRSHWVLPGLTEGELLTGAPDAAGIAAFYLERGVQLVAVKCGARGAELFTADGAHHTAGAFDVDTVDTVGAGDGFAAGLISAGLDGLDPAAALQRAAAVGALATTSAGDSDGLPTRAELDAFIARACA